MLNTIYRHCEATMWPWQSMFLKLDCHVAKIAPRNDGRGGLFLFFFLLLTLFSLTSCGFHPRGKINLAAPLQNIYIKTSEPYDQLTLNLKKYLKLSGVYVTESPSEATTTLEIINESKLQQQLSVSGTQQTRQYNLIVTATFRVSNSKGIVVAAPQFVSETRTITIQANQIMGGSNEANTLYTLMYQALAYDIMMRLGSQNMTDSVTAKHPT